MHLGYILKQQLLSMFYCFLKLIFGTLQHQLITADAIMSRNFQQIKIFCIFKTFAHEESASTVQAVP
jgi:hypothetical protein